MPSIIPKITINGKESTEISGLMIVSLPPITKPAMRAQAEEIDGRDGDQIEKLGFSAYDKTIKIALSGNYDVDDVIEYFNQDGIIIFSNEPDKYYHFKQLEGIDFEKLMRYKTADVVFHCQPFKFSTTEEEQIFSNPESVNITNSGNYFSKPEIVLTGKGNMEMSINDAPVLAIDFGDEEQTIAIDAQSMNAYGTKNNIKEAIFEINPSQDLHGYDSAWLDSETPFKKPYNLINVAGTASRIGNAMIDKIIGGSFAWNQLVQYETVVKQGLTATMDSDGVVSVSGTSTASWSNITYGFEPIDNHKYFIGRTIVSNPNNISLYWGFLNVNQTPRAVDFTSSSSSYNIVNINSHTGQSTGVAGFENGTDFTGFKFKLTCIDLTQMLGSTIADYIYSLEQATAGAGVAYFRALFPDDYYPYNAGELLSVKTSAHIMRNASNAILANYPLDANLELRGIPQIDANGNLSYDGDEYTSDGNVLRKYGIVDLGALEWTYNTTTWNNPIFYAQISDKANGFNMICVPYITSTSGGIGGLEDKHTIGSSNNYIYIRDSAYTDATAFKASLSGNYLIYEKATATTETADAFASPQIVDASGSMEYVDARAVKIPVGHVSMYANNCEILGFTESNVSQTGTGISKTIPVAWAVNQWDEEWELGIIGWAGQNAPDSSKIRCKNYIPCEPIATYYVKAPKGIQLFYYDDEKKFISYEESSKKDTTFITPANAYYMRFYVNDASYGTSYNQDISINSPASDHNYHAYSGIPTAYRAQLIFLDGTWELRLLSKKINMGNLSFTKYPDEVSQYYIFYARLSDKKNNEANSGLSSLFPVVNGNATSAQDAYNKLSTDNTMIFSANTQNPYVYIRCDHFTDATAFKTAMKNIDLEYEMQSPVSISLSADELTSLLGINNIWHDANGETQITFTKDGDVEHEISGMIATFYIDVDDLVFGVFKNRLIIGDYDKIQLKKGSNTISFAPIEEGSEISNMAIDYYSRWL